MVRLKIFGADFEVFSKGVFKLFGKTLDLEFFLDILLVEIVNFIFELWDFLNL